MPASGPARALANLAIQLEFDRLKRARKDWRLLPWGSAQFGFSAARLDLPVETGGYRRATINYASRLTTALEECRAARVRHVITSVDASNVALIHAVEGPGLS
jgi:hypothetical protein